MYKKVKYIPIDCEIACNKLKRSMPYKWDLNIYRGCEHGCKYCYAIYSHKYINSNNYFEEIYVKTNIVEKLERQLNNVHYVLPGTLYLRGITRGVFFDFVKKEFPELFDRLSILYSAGSPNREYKNQLYKMVNELRHKYSLSSSYSKVMKEKLKNSGDLQMSFFD